MFERHGLAVDETDKSAYDKAGSTIAKPRFRGRVASVGQRLIEAQTRMLLSQGFSVLAKWVESEGWWMGRFTMSLRVRRYETDVLGHVNNAVYLSYLEQAAVEHSDSLGLNLEHYRELGGVWVLRHMEIDYLRSALEGDLLDIITWLHEMRGVRAIRRYEIHRANDNELLLKAQALWVWVSFTTMRPRPIPPEVLAIFEAVKDADSQTNTADRGEAM